MCKGCDKMCPKEDKLKRHMSTQSSVQTKHKLHHHIQSMHVEKPNFSCGKCTCQFRNRSSMDKHTLGHQEPMSYSCTYCQKPFKMKRPPIQHEQSMHMEKQNYPCEKSSRQFRNGSNLDKHMLGHQEPMSYTCTYCQKLCKIKQPLMEHVQSIHVKKHKFSCEECQRAIKYIKGLDKHVKELRTP